MTHGTISASQAGSAIRADRRSFRVGRSWSAACLAVPSSATGLIWSSSPFHRGKQHGQTSGRWQANDVLSSLRARRTSVAADTCKRREASRPANYSPINPASRSRNAFGNGTGVIRSSPSWSWGGRPLEAASRFHMVVLLTLPYQKKERPHESYHNRSRHCEECFPGSRR